jgi:tetratricopeptide (TPR) repeat protein
MSLLLSLLPAAAEASADELRLQAEAAFRDGIGQVPKAPGAARQSFAKSAQLYDELRQRGAGNAALYRNEGNAYFLAGDLGRAILAYRRGLRLTPDDFELRRNLSYAREEVNLPPPGALGRPPTHHRPPWLPNLPTWTPIVALALYGSAWLAWTRWRMVRRGRWLLAGGVAFVLAALMGAALGYETWEEQQEKHRPLVVIADDGVLLRRGNGLTYEPRYPTPLNRGVEARLLFERGTWVQIELSGSEIGWVPREFVLIDR